MAAGWSEREELNTRPAQWLGFLKVPSQHGRGLYIGLIWVWPLYKGPFAVHVRWEKVPLKKILHSCRFPVRSLSLAGISSEQRWQVVPFFLWFVFLFFAYSDLFTANIFWKHFCKLPGGIHVTSAIALRMLVAAVCCVQLAVQHSFRFCDRSKSQAERLLGCMYWSLMPLWASLKDMRATDLILHPFLWTYWWCCALGTAPYRYGRRVF